MDQALSDSCCQIFLFGDGLMLRDADIHAIHAFACNCTQFVSLSCWRERVGVRVVNAIHAFACNCTQFVSLSRWRERVGVRVVHAIHAFACNCTQFVSLSGWRERVGVRVVHAIHAFACNCSCVAGIHAIHGIKKPAPGQRRGFPDTA